MNIYPTNSEARLIGYILGDGTVGNTTHATCGIRVVLGGGWTGDDQFIEEIAKEMNWGSAFRKDSNKNVGTTWKRSVPQNCVERLKTMGLEVKTSYSVRIPRGWEGWGLDSLEGLLSGLWQSDGHCKCYYTVRGWSARVVYGTKSREMAKDLSNLLMWLGIPHSCNAYKQKKFRKTDTYIVRVSNGSVDEFAGLVDLRGHKKADLALCLEHQRSFNAPA